MAIIIGIFIGLFAVISVVLLVKTNKNKEKSVTEKEVTAPASDCCGTHEICEFDKIKVNETIIEYYDDEELDEYKNVSENSFTENQIEQFRDVLYTLKTEEIMLWMLSLERRKINLPSVLKSEARFLMAEA